jgi:hypothetical protein
MSADIDIDFADRSQILKLIQHTPAMQINDGKPRKHNSGVYVTDIPKDTINNCSSIEYNQAEERGYFKIDFLNVGVYNLIPDLETYERFLNTDTKWDLLLTREFCQQIVHIGNHYDTLIKMPEPVDSIPRMAMFLALIRPAKRHLIGKSWQEISREIWTAPIDDSYFFKKSHAVAYAHLVALHITIVDFANQSN